MWLATRIFGTTFHGFSASDRYILRFLQQWCDWETPLDIRQPLPHFLTHLSWFTAAMLEVVAVSMCVIYGGGWYFLGRTYFLSGRPKYFPLVSHAPFRPVLVFGFTCTWRFWFTVHALPALGRLLVVILEGINLVPCSSSNCGEGTRFPWSPSSHPYPLHVCEVGERNVVAIGER